MLIDNRACYSPVFKPILRKVLLKIFKVFFKVCYNSFTAVRLLISMVQPLRLDHSYFHIQMKKVVVMVDGDFLRMILPKIKEQNQYISPEQYSKFLIENIKSTIDEAKHEELFRILYYDCYPHRWEAPPNEPISKDKIASKKSEKFSMLFRYLGEQPGVALRMGRLAFRGLNLKKEIIEQINC